MYLLLFSLNNPDPALPEIREYPPSQEVEMIEVISRSGTCCLMSEDSFRELTGRHGPFEMVNCGIKQAKVELFRALKLNRRIVEHLPHRLILGTSSLGALKRSLHKFLTNRYAAGHPPCWLITSKVMMETMMKDQKNNLKGKNRIDQKSQDDPIGVLLQENASNPVILETEKVYLGRSSDMRLARLMILKAAQSKSPVLILGESGTGKDVIARQIGKYSQYYSRSFAPVNCAALPETLLEGELFGYMKGSFTGAVSNKMGLFQAHHGGTVFLDEIGDLSLANQAKLLLAIDTKEIRPIGSNNVIKTDVRIIAATNRNIDHMAMNGHFRDDLLHRLNVLRIFAPPLRSHPQDIPVIASHIWRNLVPDGRLSSGFLHCLTTCSWPGNVRELKSLLTSIVDLFGAVSPTSAHILAIRNSRRGIMTNDTDDPAGEQDKLSTLEAKVRLIQLQNAILGVRMAMRPVITRSLTSDNYIKESETIRFHVAHYLDQIENILSEPFYFKDINLISKTSRYRFLLEHNMKQWPETLEPLFSSWSDELQKLDEDITRNIMDLMWGKIEIE